MVKWLERFMKTRYGPLLAWQFLSLDICFNGSISTQLTRRFSKNLPLLMMTISYFSIFVGTVWKHPSSAVPWWKYFILTISSLSGDFLSLTSFKFTSLSSAVLLGNIGLFFVAPFSIFIFKRCLNWKQVIFIILGGAGIVIVFFADGVGDSRLKGNLIALGASISYAISTITQELLVKDGEIWVYIFRLSTIAVPIAATLAGIVEHNDIATYTWNGESIGYIIAYCVLLVLYDVLSPNIMKYSTATEMNLSMLTSNFYSLLMGALAFGQKLSWLYLVGFICIPAAIVGYTLTTPKEEEPIFTDPLLNEEIDQSQVNQEGG